MDVIQVHTFISGLGPQLCRLRQEKKLTQQQVAAALGVAQGSVSKMERGTLVPDLAVWIRICFLFNLEFRFPDWTNGPTF